MNYTLITYVIYLPVSIGLAIWVGHVLFRNGRGLLEDIFSLKPKLADSINRLLLVGFYLINIGYISVTMRTGMDITNLEQLIEKLSYKFGVILFVLAGMHFLNLIVLYRLRKHEIAKVATA